MTSENESATPPAPTPEPNAVDQLAAAKPVGAGITIEVIGGGEGPGWSGDCYLGVPVQKGILGTFQGSVELIQRAVEEAAGGGFYRWSGLDSKGKAQSGTFRVPGAPKMHRPNDPAAQALAPSLSAPFGGFGGPPPPTPPAAAFQDAGGIAGGGASPFGPPPFSWVWSEGQNRYCWVSPDGSPPPPGCVPPRFRPGLGSFQPQVFGAEDSETKRELAEIKAQLAQVIAKNSGGGDSSLAAILLQGMQSQSAMMMQMFGASNAAAERRAADDRAAAAERARALDKVWEAQRKALEKAPGAAPAADPILASLHKAVADKIADGSLFGGEGSRKKDPQDDMSPSERIGEKVVDALQKFAELGKTWLDKPERPEKKPAANGAAPNGTSSNGSEHADDADYESSKWVTLLEVAHEAYSAQRDPGVARDMLFACCKSMNGPDQTRVEKSWAVITQSMKTFSSAQLLGLLGKLDQKWQARAKPIADAFSTGDGRAWFDSLMTVFRETPASEEK